VLEGTLAPDSRSDERRRVTDLVPSVPSPMVRWLFPQPADRQPVKVVVLLTFALQR